VGSRPREDDDRPDYLPRQAVGIDPCFEPLLAVTRGPAVESIHRGAVAVVGGRGELLGGVGDPGAAVYLRSTAKPFQALAVVESGAADTFSVTDEELAVMCASHAGKAEHAEVVLGLLRRLGVAASALVCGPPEHTCSGKHAGMMALAVHLGASVEGYERPQHPVQQEVARTIRSLVARLPVTPAHGRESERGGLGPIFSGFDGCGVPVIRLSLCEVAWLYAQLAGGATPGLARVRDAMLAYPGLVGGDTRLDTRVMQAARGRAVAKSGAEGMHGLALLPSSVPEGERGAAIGCAIKVEDGSPRPLPVLISLCLRAHGLEEAARALEADYPVSGVNSVGEETGRLVVLIRSRDLRMVGHVGWNGSDQAELGSPRPDLKAMKLFVGRGDEREILRFLRDEWPAADEETFGRSVDWIAEPIAFILRRHRRIVAVLRGHFIGGLGSVDELIVGRGQRGLGLGSWLLDEFEAEADRRRCGRVVLRAVKGSRAEAFYRSRGYHRECVQFSYEFGYDYVRLTRMLRPAHDGTGGDSLAG
jgi:L-asparaginase II/GNAT superfamily N-acetyltransferase